jgi:S1-C subfamily serine protease
VRRALASGEPKRVLTIFAPVAAAVALAGCSLSRSSATTEQPVQPRQGPVEPTRVQVVPRLNGASFDPATIYRLYAPGVVTIISTYGTSNQAALGSGFVLDGQGYVATNAHVVRGDPPKLARATNVYVEFSDGNRVPAKIVGDDLFSDVALLKVNPAGLTLRPLRLGSSSHLIVGSPVAAIGSPFGENESLSTGVISATGRDIQSLTTFQIGDAIQTDAAINHGNSGGPLLAANGDVVGINSQIQSSSGGGEGVGFAIPVDTVRRSLDQLRRTGHVDYAFLGVTTQDLYPQLARRLGFSASRGALVAAVSAGGPAAQAGLSAGHGSITFESSRNIPTGGDAIVAVDGQPVARSADLTNLIGLKNPGQTVKLDVVRGTSRRTVSVKLTTRPLQIGPSGG